MTLQEKIKTLTETQKFFFDGILDIHSDITLQRQTKLVDWIIKDASIFNGGVINPITGNPITDLREKNYFWYHENYNMLEDLLDL